MIDLHERLSEFSYGYGATREVEQILAAIGITATPFLPSLLHEAKLGFDVAFERRGVPLLLQFKLGQSLTRFVRKDLQVPRPKINRPFWRYGINTAESEGQFQMLLKAELRGAEVYYVAPRFSDWTDYIKYYETNSVLENSLLMSPFSIRSALALKGEADGAHRVVYDHVRCHVCSRPVEVTETRSQLLGEVTQLKILRQSQPIGSLVREIWSGLNHVVEVREGSETAEEGSVLFVSYEGGSTQEVAQRQRSIRLGNLLRRAENEDAALALALGIEFWGLGAQLVLATVED